MSDKTTRTPGAPANLGEAGRALWGDVAGTYDLRPDELRVLGEACREVDLIARMEAELRDGPLTVPGSQGQPVASPLIAELRQHRTALTRLFDVLALPDADGGSREVDMRRARSQLGRTAVRARWSASA